MTKSSFFNRLSIQISAVTIFFGILAITLFCLIYAGRDYFFDFILNLGIISDNTEAYTIAIENELIDQNVSINDIDQMNAILGTSDIYNVYILDYNNETFITGSWATIVDNFVIGTTIYESNSIYNLDSYQRVIDLKDGTIILCADSYALAKTVVPFISMAAILSIIVFVVPTFLFVKHKMMQIVTLKDEVTIMSQGDLNHVINVEGKDEIAQLSKQIDNLRQSLKDKFLTEETNRKANYDLVTTLSHDLRTPLTSLRGYLEIIRLKKYRDETQYYNYLNNSIDKVNQINDLANKMFEYFLVFSKEQDTELSKISLGVIYEYILENIAALEENGFTVVKDIHHCDRYIHGNMNLIKRIINNVFSNIAKYADIKGSVNINLNVDLDNKTLIINLKNEKKYLINYIESNQIGLKSVEQMMKIHDGTLTINNDDTTFTVTLIFPIL